MGFLSGYSHLLFILDTLRSGFLGEPTHLHLSHSFQILQNSVKVALLDAKDFAGKIDR